MIKQESSTNSEQLNSKKPTTTGGQIEAGVIKPTQFVWMPYKCDNCEKAIRIKLKVISEYGNLEDIDPPYFCKNCFEGATMEQAFYTEEEKEAIYNYMKEQAPDAMGLLDKAIRKGMPKYYLIDMMIRKRLPKKIRDKVMVAINWRYQKLQATEQK